MIEYEIPTLTLLKFDELRQRGFGDLLDHALFLDLMKSPYQIARLAYEVAVFVGERPKQEEFVASIDGADLLETRARLFKAYKDFFPPPTRVALENLIDPTSTPGAIGKD